jgi:DUF3047 family protein
VDRSHRPRVRLALLVVVAVALTLGAGSAPVERIDNWDDYPPGPLDLSTVWTVYPPSITTPRFTHPPAIVLDDGRRVVHLETAGDSIRIGRAATIDVAKTPWLVWEWKPLELPERGDVRDRRRNDQAGRVMVAFGRTRILVYVWDTTAPPGTEEGPDPLEFFQRVLIVVRSGRDGLGQWHRERRDVAADFRRVFDEDPPSEIKFVGLESHSNDTHSRSAARFRSIRFESP